MTRVNPLSDQLHFSCPMLLTSKILYTVKPKKYITHVCMNTCMESTPTHNLWFWPKRPPLAFSVAEMSVAEMSGPKRPRPKSPWPKCPTFYNLTHSPAIYPFKMIYFIFSGVLEQPSSETLVHIMTIC